MTGLLTYIYTYNMYVQILKTYDNLRRRKKEKKMYTKIIHFELAIK